MSRKKAYKNYRAVMDCAINSIVRFPKRTGFYYVGSKCDDVVYLRKIEPNAQISFVPASCIVILVEGF